MLKVWKTREEMYMGNTIEYYTKSYQVIITIVKRTSVRQKGLTVNCSQRNISITNEYVTQWNKLK